MLRTPGGRVSTYREQELCNRYSDCVRHGRPESRSWSPGRGKIFLTSISPSLRLEPKLPPIPWVSGHFQAVKRAGSETDHLHPQKSSWKGAQLGAQGHIYLFPFTQISKDLAQWRRCHSDIKNSCVHSADVTIWGVGVSWNFVEIHLVVQNFDLLPSKFSQPVRLAVRKRTLGIQVRAQYFLTQINCSWLSSKRVLAYSGIPQGSFLVILSYRTNYTLSCDDTWRL
jgi:hypothetical protein